MKNTKELKSTKKYNKWIVILSIAIPLVVALLFGVNLKKMGFEVQPLTFLPPIYATINGFTAVILLTAFWAIKNKRITLHKKLITLAIVCSAAFLVMYVAYHMTSDSTKFGGEGTIKYVYYFILLTHILLSLIIIPFVLITYIRALSKDFERHKKIAKIAFPLWLYVAISGVLVYILISPYYA